MAQFSFLSTHDIAQLVHRSGAGGLTVFTDDARLGDAGDYIALLPPNSRVILRDYHRPDRPNYAARIQALCTAHNICFSVAGDSILAAELGADLHLREHDMARPFIRHTKNQQSNAGQFITASAHHAAAIDQAAA